MKRDAFNAAGGLRIETSRDWNGRWFVVWKPDVSVYVRTRKEVLKFASWPAKTPTGDSLRAWLDQMEAIDAAKQKPLPQEGLSPALLETTWGPEAHEEEDPVANTKMIT